ncbi:MAG: glycosyltransferase family 4 protein [Thermoplasmata archaeon]
MKILAIQETDWIKRGPHQQHHLLERMAKRGHEVRVIDYEYLWHDEDDCEWICTRKEMNPPSHVIEDADITLIRPGMVKVPLLDKASIFLTHKKEIQNELDEFEPDVVVAFGILNANIAMKECKKRDIPFVYYLIDHLHKLLPNKAIQNIAKRYEKKTLEGSDKILVINQGLKEYCIDMGADEEIIDVIPAGVDLDRYDPSIEAPDIKEEYGIKEEDTVLFFMGWIYDFSGMKEVAQELAKNDDENLKLMIVGEGDLYEYLQDFRDENGLKDRLILTGKVPFEEIPRYLSVADVCLLPAYKNEIMKNIVPIKMYEYMAMANPVIATELPGIKKEFGEGNGVVYIDRSKDVIVKYKELDDERLINEFGEKARSFVDDQDWENLTNQFQKSLTQF